jgi:hypothetical protein
VSTIWVGTPVSATASASRRAPSSESASGFSSSSALPARAARIWSDWRDVDPRDVDLTYQVNPGILRRTKYVEVGIDYP